MNERRPLPPLWDLAVILGGLALAAGPFLPFISASSGFGTIARNGIELIGPEVFVLVALGLLVAYIGYQRLSGPQPTGGAYWSPAILGAIALAIGALYYSQVDERIAGIDSEYVLGSVGMGLWLCLAGAGLVIVAVAFARQRELPAV